jgi:hypothetical protein
MVALVEQQVPDLQPCLASPILVTPFQIGHADIGVMASLTVHKLHTIQRVRFQDACVILVLEGSKSVSDLDCPKHAETGDIAIIPAGTVADVTSKPKPGQAYRGIILSFEQSLLTRFAETYPRVVGSKRPLGQVKILKGAQDIGDVVGRVIRKFRGGTGYRPRSALSSARRSAPDARETSLCFQWHEATQTNRTCRRPGRS